MIQETQSVSASAALDNESNIIDNNVTKKKSRFARNRVADKRITLDVSSEFVDEVAILADRLEMKQVQAIRLAVRILLQGTEAINDNDTLEIRALKEAIDPVVY
jgi:hypothetical protein